MMETGMGHMWLVLQAAVTNNGQGISGMAPLASILPIRVLDNNGSGVLSDIYCKWYYPCS
jgi:thermitase